MIELIQFPWSPFCIVQRRILEFSGAPFKITNIPSTDRSLVWKLTKQRYYGVPIIKDGKNVVFELNDDSQVIAKYLDEELQLGLFPLELEGVQSILWRYIENEIEGATFRLNDIYWKEHVPKPGSSIGCVIRNASSAAAALASGTRNRMTGSSSWRKSCCRSRKCWHTIPFCWANSRGSWTSTCSGCWKISCTPAIMNCPRRTLKSRTGIAGWPG